MNITVDGDERRFLLARPAGAAGPLPLVIEFHGSGHFAEGQTAASGFAVLGERERFAVAAPEALLTVRVRPEWPEGRAWNVPGVPLTSGESPDGPDDVAFVAALIGALADDGVADPERVYLTGFSGGARLCSYLAGVMPERIAAIGTVAGLRLPPPNVIPPPPIIAFHSRNDEINPYDGGAGPRWDLGVDETAAAFAERYGWSIPESSTANALQRDVYRDSDGGERLVAYTLDDRPHGWYGSRDPVHAEQYGTAGDIIDATAMIWDFFRGNPHRRRHR
jgi:polyhydroxybutyrate depolymerase